MSIQYVIYFSFFLLILGFFGSIYKKDFVSIMVSIQLVFFSGIINFLSFSYFIYQGSTFDKTFILIGIVTFELLVFSLLFYKYASRSLDKTFKEEDYRIFRFERSDWWGED